MEPIEAKTPISSVPPEKLKWCLFCYKSVNEYISKDKMHIQQRFITLLRRHFEGDKDWCSLSLELERVLECGNNSSVLCCEDCYKTVESFCDLYNQLKCLELKINWRMWTLMNIMVSTDKVPARVQKFRDSLSVENVGEDRGLHEKFGKFRTHLIAKCSRKILHAFPKISLEQHFGKKSDRPRRLNFNLEAPTPSSSSSPPSLTPSNTISSEDVFKIEVSSTFLAKHEEMEIGTESPSNCQSSLENAASYPVYDTLVLSPQPNHGLNVSRELNWQNLDASLDSSPFFEVSEDEEEMEIEVATTPDPATNKLNLNKELSHKNCDIHTHTQDLELMGTDDVSQKDLQPLFSLAVVEKSDCFEDALNKKSQSGITALSQNIIESSLSATLSQIDLTSALSPTPNPPVRRLRPVHRCSKCNKTFSTLANRENHEKTDHSLNYKDKLSSDEDSTNLDLDEDSESDLALSISDSESDSEQDVLTNVGVNSDRVGDSGTYKISGDSKINILKTLLTEETSSITKVERYAQELKNPFKSHDRVRVVTNNSKIKKFISPSEKHTAANKTIKAGMYRREELGKPNKKQKRKRRYYCRKCDKAFNSMDLLERHRNIHKVSGHVKVSLSHYRCPRPSCHKTFRLPKQLVNHVVKEHSATSQTNEDLISSCLVKMTPEEVDRLAPKFFCTVDNCTEMFRFKDQLDDHSKFHGKFKCHACDVNKDFAPDLARHELKHSLESEIQKFKCIRCSFSSTNIKIYIRHHLETHLALVVTTHVKCPICSKPIKFEEYDYRSLDQHHEVFHNIANMDQNDVQRCDQCPAYFKAARHLQSHRIRIHSSGLTCADCGKIFRNTMYLQKHRRKMHIKPENLRFQCTAEDCGKKFETLLEMENHAKFLHSAIAHPKLSCPTCGKVFYRSGLLAHIRSVHQNKKPKRYSGPERKHVCDECGKAFKNIDVLRMHKFSHSGPSSWEFSCSICRKKCLNKGKLKEHMRTHTKEKPFICQVCGEAYAHRHNLRNHANKKHGDVIQDIPRKTDLLERVSSKKGKRNKPVYDSNSDNEDIGMGSSD